VHQKDLVFGHTIFDEGHLTAGPVEDDGSQLKCLDYKFKETHDLVCAELARLFRVRRSLSG